MKIFLSSLSMPVIKKIHEINTGMKPNVLITFFNFNEIKPQDYVKHHRNKINGLILDCGTYSINDKFKDNPQVIERECDRWHLLYRDYTKLKQNDFDCVFSFDGDFTPDGFDNNIQRLIDLEAAGVKAVPVIHNLHNQEIEYFIDAKPDYPLVAIGQCQDDKRDDLKVLFEAVDKLYRAGIKVHLFGMTTPSLTSYIPAYSCDSKTWADYASRGRALYHNHESGLLNKEELIYFPKNEKFSNDSSAIYFKKYKYLDAFLAHIKSKLNLELNDIRAQQTHIESLNLINTLYFMELEERITEENRLRGITFE